jgi:hypothetical protein
VRLYQPPARALRAVRRDAALRRRVVLASGRGLGARLLSYASGPKVPRDAEETRLISRALVSEATIDGLKVRRTALLTRLRGFHKS